MFHQVLCNPIFAWTLCLLSSASEVSVDMHGPVLRQQNCFSHYSGGTTQLCIILIIQLWETVLRPVFLK